MGPILTQLKQMDDGVGWGNAQRYLLSGDLFDATEAHRIGLAQELVAPEELFTRGLEIAKKIADTAPWA